MTSVKKVSSAAHRAGVSLRKGSPIAALAESERAQLNKLKGENRELKSEILALRKELKKPKPLPKKKPR